MPIPTGIPTQRLTSLDALRGFDMFWILGGDSFVYALHEMSGNPALVIARAPISDLVMPVLHRFMVSSRLSQRALVFHRRILEEIEAADPDAAALMMRKHVNDFRTGWERAGLNLSHEFGTVSEDVIQAAVDTVTAL